RAYTLARAGQEVRLGERHVEIHDVSLITYDYPRLRVEVRCGKGTYIRSLARDLGAHFGGGALVETLRRTRVGPFTVEEVVPLPADPQLARSRLLAPGAAVSDLLPIQVPSAVIDRLRKGQRVSWKGAAAQANREGEVEVAVFDDKNQLAAIACWDTKEN